MFKNDKVVTRTRVAVSVFHAHIFNLTVVLYLGFRLQNGGRYLVAKVNDVTSRTFFQNGARTFKMYQVSL